MMPGYFHADGTIPIMLILGIESSCDETAAAVVADGRRVLSSVVASQVDVHHRFGGVVPELASRKHIEAILPVVQEALSRAGIAREDLEGVAVTQGPGLVGSLLVGYSFAKALAYGLRIPWVGVNHLEGHLLSVFLEENPPPFPFCALLASGGHTGIYYVRGFTRIERLGQTRDDAYMATIDQMIDDGNIETGGQSPRPGLPRRQGHRRSGPPG